MRKQMPENLIGDSREAFLRRSIIEAGFTLKDFAIHAGLPPTSLGTILKRGVGTTSVDTAIQICDALGISLETLARYPQSPDKLGVSGQDGLYSLVPPWVRFPTVPANSEAWKTNETLVFYTERFNAWWATLSDEQKGAYSKVYSATESWNLQFKSR